jgi:tetratricopeptide (TPR) repeat protein
MLTAGHLREAVPLLLGEVSARPNSAWLNYRLAWALDRLDMPDSALVFAERAWSLSPSRERYLAELLKSLSMSGRSDEVLALAGYVRGGGVARYYVAAAGDAASLSYLRTAAGSEDDSTAADACCWLSILCLTRSAAESSIALLERSVSLEPADPFYRSLLIQREAEAGMLEEAMDDLAVLRMARSRDPLYWEAAASVAEAEGDDVRLAWALRRSWQARQTAESGRALGWALFSCAGRALYRGDPELAGQWLEEAAALGVDSVLCERTTEMLGAIAEFEERSDRW